MRIYDLEIEGQSYDACCGIRVLGKLQKKYGSLTKFERKILPYRDTEKSEKSEENLVAMIDVEDIDIEAVFDTAKLFLEEGAFLTGEKIEAEKILCAAGDYLNLALRVFDIYIKSMKPDNEENIQKTR